MIPQQSRCTLAQVRTNPKGLMRNCAHWKARWYQLPKYHQHTNTANSHSPCIHRGSQQKQAQNTKATTPDTVQKQHPCRTAAARPIEGPSRATGGKWAHAVAQTHRAYLSKSTVAQQQQHRHASQHSAAVACYAVLSARRAWEKQMSAIRTSTHHVACAAGL